MIATWIIITLMLAVLIGIIGAGGAEDDRLFGFIAGVFWTCNISFWIGVIYVAGHFISKYW